MSRKNGIVELAMRHRQLVFLVVGILIALGGYALLNMPRQEFPTFTIRQGLVVGIYPGATSSQVEKQLTTEVERYLFSFKEIKKEKTYSHSKDGLMVVYVELNDNVTDADEFWSKLKHGLINLKSQLPSGVLGLYADNDFGDTSALLVTIESNNKSYRELETYLNNLEDRLRRIQSVSKLRHYGLQKEQISIYLEKNKLEKYGLNTSTLLATMFTQGYVAAGGAVDNGSVIAPIHVTSPYQSENDIAQQIIYSDPGGHVIRLKDVASVVREYPEPDSYIQNNGKKCLLISMEMQPGNNIVQYGNDVDKVLTEFQKELPTSVTIQRIADQPKVVEESIITFLRELLYAIIAVIIVTMLLLPLRVASVAASSIPITIFISLGLMSLFGMELNTVTLAGLIVTLGMIVDNSIVIVDSYMERLDHGISRWHASILSAQAFFKAIVSATLAISITFFPFLFTLKGLMVDFVKLFPWTITITLGISLFVAMLVIPYLQYFFIKKGFKQIGVGEKRKGIDFLGLIQRNYDRILGKAFSKPKLTIGLGLLVVAIGMFLFRYIPQRLMPIAERDQFAVEIYLPQGSSLNQTAEVSDRLEKTLKKDDRVKSITAFIGTSSPRFHTAYAPNMPAKNYAQFIVNTISTQATADLLDKFSKEYPTCFANAYVRFKQLDYQPVAAPLEVRLSGDSVSALKTISERIISKMRNIKGVNWVRTDNEEMLPEVRVDVNNEEANLLGIDKTTVATNLAMRYSGLPMTTIWENDYPLSVVLKSGKLTEQSFEDVNNEYIHSVVPGVSVPLRQIATVKPDWEQGQLVRRNGVPTLTVMADVDRGINVNKIFPEVKSMVESISLPHGVNVSYGGAYEADSEALPQIMGALVISIFIIFLILVFHFRKINLALLVLASAALCVPGAVLGVLLLNVQFGVTSILGLVALIGILVRNGIIMLDYAEELRIKQNKSIYEAAFEAGKRRMRPIFLTSAAASMGVVPMIISHSALWCPMGAVICFGSIVSMVLIVLILPVAYYLLFKGTDKKRVKLPASGIIKSIALLVFLSIGTGYSVSGQNVYTLEQCKALAVKNNVTVKNSRLETEASEQTKKAAYTKYFPSVSADVMSLRAVNPLIKANIPSANLPVYNGDISTLANATQFAYFPGMQFSAMGKATMEDVSIVQPVYAGKRVTNGNKLAELGINVSKSKELLSVNEVLQKTEEQYWGVVELNEKMKTLDAYTELLSALYKQANDAFHAGLINRNDVLKVTLKQSETRMNRLKLENGIKLATMALCQYTGIPYAASVSFVDEFNNSQIPDKYFIDPQKAVRQREEYALLQKGVDAEELQTRIKQGEYMPEVGVGISEVYQNITSNNRLDAVAFVSVKIPISGWWEASHTMKERRIQEQIARNDQRNKTELLVLQIQKAWNDLSEAYKQIAVAEETIGQAEENLKVNSDNYKSGIVNISDMLEAQAMLQQSNDQLINARVTYATKLVAYLQATGRYSK